MPSINCSVLGDWSLPNQETVALSFGADGVLAVSNTPTPMSLRFLSWETGAARNLVTLNSAGIVSAYTFTLSSDQYTLTVSGASGAILNGTYSRISGAPGPMGLSNPFIGACDVHTITQEMVNGDWRWHFVPEGYVSTTHLTTTDHGHSFINAYMVYPDGDGGVNYLFILGQMWFGMAGGRLSEYTIDGGTGVITATETASGVVWELTYATAPPSK